MWIRKREMRCILKSANLIEEPKKIACLNDDQQLYYNRLPPRQKKYVEFRSRGFCKADSYRKAGYSSNNSNQSAYNLEKKDKNLADIINTILGVKKVTDVLKADSNIGRQIDALAKTKNTEDILAKIENADDETIKQIKFFRDICDGKLKTVRRTTYTNAKGEKSYKVEECTDLNIRMTARRELDRLLGLNSVLDIGKIETGDITINIVDASKKDESGDKENKLFNDLQEKSEEIDGEIVIVDDKEAEGEVENDKPAKKKGKALNKPIKEEENGE